MPLTLIGDKSRRDQPLLECYLLSARVNRVVIRVRTGWILGSKASEALTNVHRHSGSRTAGIALTRDANSATLEIRDQGCGIPPGVIETAEGEVSRLGVGIAGMRERVRQLGGKLEISGQPNGTEIRAILPLAAT